MMQQRILAAGLSARHSLVAVCTGSSNTWWSSCYRDERFESF